ncbi:MAG: hypothetical protein J6A94_02265 [Lachnospiraceae bacterium]|nr:hypothetical protein [Lachnospiraceae bacterium]
MKKWLTVVSTLVLIVILWLIPTEYDVQAITTVSGGDVGIGEVHLDSDFDEMVIEVAGHVNYEAQLWCNGEHVATWIDMAAAGGDVYYWGAGISEYIGQSGVYKARLKVWTLGEEPNEYNSMWSEFSNEVEYNAPDKKLGTVEPKWDSEAPGVLTFNEVEGAKGYITELYREEESGLVNVDKYIFTERSEGTVRVNFYEAMMETPGKYLVTVWAYSDDINEIANGDKVSIEYESIADKNTEITGIITEAMKNSDASKALAAIQEQISLEELSTAMQNSSKIRNKISDLESVYREQVGINKKTNSSEEVKKIMDTSRIFMVGGALNGMPGSTVTLDVSVPEEKIAVDEKYYADPVQIDIKLSNNGANITELKVPITITMPIPNSLKDKDLSKLVITHYSSVDGSGETVKFVNNGNDTIQFTVTHFSTFVFALETGEKIPENNNVDNNESVNNNDDDNDVDEDDNEVEDNDSAEVVVGQKDNVPKTGECNVIGWWIALAVVCGAGAVFFSRKNTYN